MNIQFTNQTVIVTGAAHGFGRGIALAFAQRRPSPAVSAVAVETIIVSQILVVWSYLK